MNNDKSSKLYQAKNKQRDVEYEVQQALMEYLNELSKESIQSIKDNPEAAVTSIVRTLVTQIHSACKTAYA